MTRALVLTLLAIWPRMAARRCLESRADEIADHLETGRTAHGVPPEILASVGWHETWLGCHPGEGGGWGAPIDVRHRHTAGTPEHAARALARSYAVCGTWRGAVTRFRSGLCRLPAGDSREQYVASVMRLARRLAP